MGHALTLHCFYNRAVSFFIKRPGWLFASSQYHTGRRGPWSRKPIWTGHAFRGRETEPGLPKGRGGTHH
jgi:hypothetical protein